MSAPKILLAADDGHWHRRRLLAAFAARGIAPARASLASLSLSTAAAEPIGVPGLGGALPDGIFVRTMSGGSFEATTLRLSFLHGAEAAGAIVWNRARAIECAVDKAMTSLLLARAGVPTPETFATSDAAAAADYVRARASPEAPLVLKPLFGSQGKGLRLIAAPEDLPEPAAVGGVYYLQRKVGPRQGPYRDYRVFVVDGEPIAGMIRQGAEWITNLRQGGEALPWSMPQEARDLGVRAAALAGAAYCGVDLIADRGGALLALEVNSMPSWSGLQRVCAFDIADHLASRFLARVARR